MRVNVYLPASETVSTFAGKEVTMDVKLGHIPETLLLPLQARAQHTKAGNPILADPVAVALLEELAYYFSACR